VRGVFLEDPPLFAGSREDAEPSPIVTMFGVMRQVLGDMQSRGAPIEEYETLLRGAPAMGGTGTMTEMLGEEGARAQARAMASLDPEVFTPALDGTALAGVDPCAPLGCPTVVLRADPTMGAAFSPEDERDFVAANPHAKVTLFEGAGHLLHDALPDRYIRELSDFLTSVK